MTPAQVRMARAALDLTPEELSREAGVTPDDLKQIEQGGHEGAASAKVRTTLEGLGVSFLGADVVRYDERLRHPKTVPLEEMNSFNDE